ncbi:MAG: hypothetical protein HZA78_00445 [Candidatus Schekmanbacteria bacterium]|nr:hypothetical protein [Candidatus Schekmanbacteria bacterium]
MSRKSVKLFVFPIMVLFFFTGCISKTNIRPYYSNNSPNKLEEKKQILLYVSGVSGKSFSKACAPAGNCITLENSTDISNIIQETVKDVFEQKGYEVSVKNSLPANKEKPVFLVDVKNVDAKWQSGLFHSEAELFMQINNRLISPSGEIIIDYTFEKRGKEGGLIGNCIAAGAGATIVGLIPFFIYLGNVGDESTQLSNAGNMYIEEYAKALSAQIP